MKPIRLAIILVFMLNTSFSQQCGYQDSCKRSFLIAVLSDTSLNSPFVFLNLKYKNRQNLVFVRSRDIFKFLSKYNHIKYPDYLLEVVNAVMQNSSIEVRKSYKKSKTIAIVTEDYIKDIPENYSDEAFLDSTFLSSDGYLKSNVKADFVWIAYSFFNLGYIIKEGDFVDGIFIKKIKCKS